MIKGKNGKTCESQEQQGKVVEQQNDNQKSQQVKNKKKCTDCPCIECTCDPCLCKEKKNVCDPCQEFMEKNQ